MNLSSNRIQLWYQKALRLYPAAYQKEYGEEMQTVFELRLASVSGVSGREKLKFCLRELRDLPASVVAAYIRERNRLKMKNNLERWFVQEPGSVQEALLAIIPFFLTAFLIGLFSIIPAINNLPMRAGQIILLTLTFVQIILGGIGLMVRLPRWSMPYVGVLVALAPFSILTILYHQGVFRLPQGIMFLSTIVFHISYLIVLFLLLSFIVWAAGKIRLTHLFANQVRQDKTLLSFMMYGGSLVFMTVNYEDTIGGGVYLMASALAMMLGAWLYLSLKSARFKIAALSLGNTAAIFIALLANMNLLSFQSSTLFSLGSIEITILDFYVILTWLVSQIMIFAPLLLGNIFGSRKGEPESLAV